MENPESGLVAQCWWGECPLAANRMRRLQLGPLELWMQRLENEWLIAWGTNAAPQARPAEVSLQLPLEPPTAGMHVARFSFQDAAKPVHLLPILADRSVVVKPDVPFFIPPGEAVTLFVSTPMWLRIIVGSDGEPLLDIPTLRPSDTWFGPDTRIGELCYAGRMLAQTRVADLAWQPHRAITPVRIRNEAAGVLPIERLRVPVPLLALGVDAQGRFWTQALTLERRARSDDVSLQLGTMSLPGAAVLQAVSGPRQVESERTMRRALSRFFG